MKKSILFLFITITVLFNSCTNGQNHTTSKGNLSATEFAEKINQISDAVIIDVRTPEEFEKGHLENALNYNWNGINFQNQISGLDKSKPVFVYCLSGGKSAAATNKMRTEGFKEIYELSGGIMKWRAASFVETKGYVNPGMTKNQFNELLNSEKLVLIDFYAVWCAPCKKMAPYLEEIKNDMKDRVEVIRINVDDNQPLCRELGVEALPVLQLYKNKDLLWNNTGYISKEDVLKKLQ